MIRTLIIGGIILIVPLFFVLVFVMSSYNKLIALRKRYQKALNSLREELACTESKVAIARQAFNDRVIDYNTARRKFPTNLIALLFHFSAAELWSVEEPEQKEASKTCLLDSLSGEKPA